MKRLMDLALSLFGLVILIIPIGVLAVMVYLKLGSPIFFKQMRPGLNGKLFCMIKFRTMSEGLDNAGNLLADGQRLLPLGRFLRATSLDELPEVWNVLKGEMSFVGPRPLLVEYLPLYSIEQARRLNVLPGITGWAQVNGRNAISWEEKFALDIWYLDNYSLWLDIKILLLTIQKVLKREGISPETEVIMPKFMGQQKAEDIT